MSKKKYDIESKICLTPKPSQSFWSKTFFLEKELFNEKGESGLNKKRKGNCLTALATEEPHNINKKAHLWTESPRENSDNTN